MIIANNIEHYIEKNCTDENKLLHQINRKTYLEQLYPQMVSGKVQGQVLRMFSQMIQPKRILEVGTFTAYSTICLASGLASGGIIDTIEIEEELEPVIQQNIEAAGIRQQVNIYIGEAKTVVPKLTNTYDLIFLDADKEFYPQYYEMLHPIMANGGYLIADNVLWYGKVTDPPESFDVATKGVVEFNKIVHEDPSVENVILSVRDGLMLVRKIKSLL